MDRPDLTLASHPLCPYVQRAAIALIEKAVPFERRDVDLANKPDWFRAVSPLGRTPVLLVGDRPIFESAVILEYLEETCGLPLHPSDPLERATHRSWIEFASAVLNDIAGFYSARDGERFAGMTSSLAAKFSRVEDQLGTGPYFSGEVFSLVDAAFAPVFRYFDAFDRIGEFGILDDKPKVAAWRMALASRRSVRDAVSADFGSRLHAFLQRRQSCLSALMPAVASA